MNIDKSAIANELSTALSGEQSNEPDVANTATPPQQAPNQEFFELPWEGKALKIPLNYEFPIKEGDSINKVPFSNLLNKYRLTGVLENKVKELQTKYAPYEKEVGDLNEWKTKTEKYRVLQDWSEQNPEDFEKLYSLFQQAKAGVMGTPGQEQSPQMQQALTKLYGEIETLKQELGGFKEKETEIQNQKDAEFIQGQISEFQKEYPFFKLEEKNVDGISRRDAIIHFGIQNGYPDFISAAMALHGKDLVKLAQEESRKSLSEEIKKNNKDGVITRQRIPNGQFEGKTERRPINPSDRKTAALSDLNDLLSKQS